MNETLNVLSNLRTIHGNFSDEIIAEKDIDTIIDATLHTANASARQSYSIVVVDDKEKMKALFGYTGSHAFIFCVDYTRLVDTAPLVNCSFDNTNVFGFLTGSTDTILAAQTSVIAAKSMGIDSLITNGIHRSNINDVYAILKLPQTSCFPLIAVVFGYPQKTIEHKKGRLSKEFLVFRNEYRRLSHEELAATVAEYDDAQKHIGLISNWAELGYTHYLEWFYKKWTVLPCPEKNLDGKLLELQTRLVTSGFWFC